MIIDQQKSITFLIRTSSNYFWASEVGKNQGFQIKFINLSISKLVSNWNPEHILKSTLIFI